ncbi:hypothetical protein LWI28_000142 [Acer negundo]|uniref:Uncharacterized protein n=1 Tax=Acer negundo TaxID=4023 RepID=A0AAD5P3L1_ACENE|nr:hypothetical protein LWI28_000142 [Acer negundo]
MVSVGAVGEILKHPDEIYFLLKLKMVLSRAEKQMTPNEPHWRFCYTMLYKSMRSDIISHPMFPPVDTHFRNAVETIDDYDEYCYHVAGLFGICLSKLFNASGKQQDPALENLSNSLLMLFQDFKYEENSVKAVQCLNEMVTDALKHVGDCLNHMSALKDNAALQLSAMCSVVGFGTLALCYNNIQVFKAGVKLRPGLVAKIVDRTKTMSDVYNAFFEFASLMKSKVETIDDYDEYCYHVAGLFGICLSKLFNASGKQQDPALENLSNSLLMLFQDFKYEENSVKAVQCLNEMVTDALKHVGDCLNHMSALKDNAAFQLSAMCSV